MNNWKIEDSIKRGIIDYQVGDEVVIFKRKKNGHPRSIKDDTTYIIKKIDYDGHLHVIPKNFNIVHATRVHKMYMIQLSILREIKLNSIFN